MRRVLMAWVGRTDLNAASGAGKSGKGPIGQAVEARAFDELVLLCNYPEEEVDGYRGWLSTLTKAEILLRRVALSDPTEYGEIYGAAVEAVSETLERLGKEADLTFHLSPGTPAMASVWLLLGKSKYKVGLIKSSPEKGVEDVEVPFAISADFIPDLLRKPDEELERLMAGMTPSDPAFGNIIHKSVEMKRVIARSHRVAARLVPVLIEGESGTGKELLAKAIHKAGPYGAKTPVIVNCGAIPATLLESELFGHKKGSFTGATADREGKFVAAHQNTLFLDEVGELPPEAQVKLLRVLQEGEVTPVGGEKSIKVSVRVIAATNRSLMQEVAEGRFRQDLFYRLAVAILRLPPLRDRKGDMSLLVDHLLAEINAEAQRIEPGYKDKKLSAEGRNLLLGHDWPGNIRELKNTLARAAIWAPGQTIEARDAREAILPTLAPSGGEVLGRPLGDGFSLEKTLETVTRHYLERAAEESHGVKKKAAELLGFRNYQTLSNWMKKYGVGD